MMANKRQRENRAIRRELWRDELVKLGLVEKTLGVWRSEKLGVDLYPSKLRAYNYIKQEYVDWNYILKELNNDKAN